MKKERRYKLEINAPERYARVKWFTTMEAARKGAEKLKFTYWRPERDGLWAHTITRPLYGDDS
jgi:hypothetical protein